MRCEAMRDIFVCVRVCLMDRGDIGEQRRAAGRSDARESGLPAAKQSTSTSMFSGRGLIRSTDHHREEEKKNVCPAFPAPTPSCRPSLLGTAVPPPSAGQLVATHTHLLTTPASQAVCTFCSRSISLLDYYSPY